MKKLICSACVMTMISFTPFGVCADAVTEQSSPTIKDQLNVAKGRLRSTPLNPAVSGQNDAFRDELNAARNGLNPVEVPAQLQNIPLPPQPLAGVAKSSIPAAPALPTAQQLDSWSERTRYRPGTAVAAAPAPENGVPGKLRPAPLNPAVSGQNDAFRGKLNAARNGLNPVEVPAQLQNIPLPPQPLAGVAQSSVPAAPALPTAQQLDSWSERTKYRSRAVVVPAADIVGDVPVSVGTRTDEQASVPVASVEQNKLNVDLFNAISGKVRPNLKNVNELLDKGADVNATVEGQTMLYWPVITQNSELVRLFLAKGAKINARDSEGLTVLHHCASLGNLSAIQFLLGVARDVNVDPGINSEDNNGNTPLAVALQEGDSEIAKYLIECGGTARNYPLEKESMIKSSNGQTLIANSAQN
ncbi:hypothetical protein FACS1894122_14450 [Alphaproteobacteria bacterium]|nr:hypothetical protein FACS1894122_14450 [Alphaproteobacteria bacterium]